MVHYDNTAWMIPTTVHSYTATRVWVHCVVNDSSRFFFADFSAPAHCSGSSLFILSWAFQFLFVETSYLLSQLWTWSNFVKDKDTLQVQDKPGKYTKKLHIFSHGRSAVDPRSARQACSGLHGFVGQQPPASAGLQHSVVLVVAWPFPYRAYRYKGWRPSVREHHVKNDFLYIMYFSDLTCHLACMRICTA